MSQVSKIFNAARRAITDRRLLEEVGAQISRPLIRVFGQPGMQDLHQLGGTDITLSPEEFVSQLYQGNRLEELETILEEFDALHQAITQRIAQSPLGYPSNFKVGYKSSVAIYALLRLTRPATIVETGIANGVSTAIILQAIRANGRGELFSIDVRNDVGGLLTDDERRNWRPIIINGHPLDREFVKALDALPPIDFFLHDSNHTYRWQSLEYENALTHLSPNGLLMSDDIDLSWAFIELVRHGNFSKVAKLLDSGKVLAGVRKPSPPGNAASQVN